MDSRLEGPEGSCHRVAAPEATPKGLTGSRRSLTMAIGVEGPNPATAPAAPRSGYKRRPEGLLPQTPDVPCPLSRTPTTRAAVVALVTSS